MAQDEEVLESGTREDGSDVNTWLPWGEVRLHDGFAMIMGPTLPASERHSQCQMLIYGNGNAYQVLSQELTSLADVTRAAQAFFPPSSSKAGESGGGCPSWPASLMNAESFALTLGLRRCLPSASPVRRRAPRDRNSAPRLRPLEWLSHVPPLPTSELERLREQREVQCRYRHGGRLCKSSTASTRSVGNGTVSKCTINMNFDDDEDTSGDENMDDVTSRRTDVPPQQSPAHPPSSSSSSSGSRAARVSASAARAAAATADWAHRYTPPRRRPQDGLSFRSRALLRRCRPCSVRLQRVRVSSPLRRCDSPAPSDGDEAPQGVDPLEEEALSSSSSTISVNSCVEVAPANETLSAARAERGNDAGLSGHLLCLLSRCKPCVVALARVAAPSPRRRTRVRTPRTRCSCFCTL